MLDEARVLGLDRLLAVCALDNLASAKTIERRGGVLEDIRDTNFGPARRYWIELLATRSGAHICRRPSATHRNRLSWSRVPGLAEMRAPDLVCLHSADLGYGRA